MFLRTLKKSEGMMLNEDKQMAKSHQKLNRFSLLILKFLGKNIPTPVS